MSIIYILVKNMYISLIVLFSCFLTAVSNIFLKKGMRTSNPTTAMLFSLLVTWLMLGALTLVFATQYSFTARGVYIYLLIGCFAPLIVRFFTYKGIDLLGAARSAPIRSFTPLFAYFLAVLFQGENFNPPVFIGTLFIIGGALNLSREKEKDLESKVNPVDFLYPLVAAVLAGVATNLRKYGFNYLESPIFAAFLTASSAFFLFSLFLLTFKKGSLIQINKNSVKHFTLASLCTSVTILFTLFSLKHANVTLVAPLLATIPLFTLFLSIFFLKKEEKVTKKVILGTILTGIGMQLVIFFTN